MISASKTTFSLNNLKILRPKVTKNPSEFWPRSLEVKNKIQIVNSWRSYLLSDNGALRKSNVSCYLHRLWRKWIININVLLFFGCLIISHNTMLHKHVEYHYFTYCIQQYKNFLTLPYTLARRGSALTLKFSF